jgi:hypothetical protein
MDENPFNAGSPGAEEVDLYGKFRKNPRIYSEFTIVKMVAVVVVDDKHGLANSAARTTRDRKICDTRADQEGLPKGM